MVSNITSDCHDGNKEHTPQYQAGGSSFPKISKQLEVMAGIFPVSAPELGVPSEGSSFSGLKSAILCFKTHFSTMSGRFPVFSPSPCMQPRATVEGFRQHLVPTAMIFLKIGLVLR
jgi:hypothetical protein